MSGLRLGATMIGAALGRAGVIAATFYGYQHGGVAGAAAVAALFASVAVWLQVKLIALTAKLEQLANQLEDKDRDK